MKRKIYKLITKPGIFFRDFFNKRYPVVNNELACEEQDEIALLKYSLRQDQDFLNKEEKFPIDVVYTWVNKNSIWRDEFNSTYKDYQNEMGQYASDDARFEDHDELFYSLKSIRRFIPWVRKVFVVTNSAYNLPDFLKNGKDVVIVTHAEIIDKAYLPTFNSHVIEAHLHKIRQLSENFIYFNDDVFVARKLSREHFFQSNGLASLYISSKKIDEMSLKGVHTPSLLAAMYSQNLLSREFGTYINQTLVHTYIPLKKSMYEFAWELYQDEIEGFLGNRFRGNKDINMATFLVPWLMYIHGNASIATDICYYFNIRSPHAKTQYERLLLKPKNVKPHSICANDFYSDNEEAHYRESFKRFLKTYFTESI